MGGANATIIFAVLLIPVFWLVTRTPGPRRRSLMGWWVVAVGCACFWWVFSLLLAGKYGYNYLPYTETASDTTSTTSAFESPVPRPIGPTTTRSVARCFREPGPSSRRQP